MCILIRYNYQWENQGFQSSLFCYNYQMKKKKKNFKTCGTISEDFNPNNVAMSLCLVFVKYIYTCKLMATWSLYQLA